MRSSVPETTCYLPISNYYCLPLCHKKIINLKPLRNIISITSFVTKIKFWFGSSLASVKTPCKAAALPISISSSVLCKTKTLTYCVH